MRAEARALSSSRQECFVIPAMLPGINIKVAFFAPYRTSMVAASPPCGWDFTVIISISSAMAFPFFEAQKLRTWRIDGASVAGEGLRRGDRRTAPG
jgi:hypothetical protein